mmetsp:Transcript_30281/g.27572  ORF Transcript_30281/g.27572 Transcript_30281/m.27572 type:complete len:277 (-) Transcript_30281:37-867(-)
MLNDDDIVVTGGHLSHGFGGSQSLLDIQIRTGLIEHVDGDLLHGNDHDSESLKFTTRQFINVSFSQMGEVEFLQQLFADLSLVSLLDNVLDFTLDNLWQTIHVLGLNGGLELVFEELGKEVLKLRSSEMFDDISPVRRAVILAEIGLDLVGENLEGSGLTGTIGADETEDLASSWGWKSVKLEGVGSITMGGKLGEIVGKVDDLDGFERALLDAETATYTEWFSDCGDFGSGFNFDAELSGFVDGAALLTLLLALLGLTLFVIDDSDSQFVVHGWG